MFRSNSLTDLTHIQILTAHNRVIVDSKVTFNRNCLMAFWNYQPRNNILN